MSIDGANWMSTADRKHWSSACVPPTWRHRRCKTAGAQCSAPSASQQANRAATPLCGAERTVVMKRIVTTLRYSPSTAATAAGCARRPSRQGTINAGQRWLPLLPCHKVIAGSAGSLPSHAKYYLACCRGCRLPSRRACQAPPSCAPSRFGFRASRALRALIRSSSRSCSAVVLSRGVAVPSGAPAWLRSRVG